MKMSDTPSVNVQTMIRADAERIYDMAADLDSMASHGTEFQGGSWVSGRPGSVGSSFVGRQKLGDLEWETTSTVTAAEPGRRFAWRVGTEEDFTATWTLTLTPVPKGTEVDYGFVHGPGPSGLRSRVEADPSRESEIIDSRLATLQDNMIKTLEGIRRRCER